MCRYAGCTCCTDADEEGTPTSRKEGKQCKCHGNDEPAETTSPVLCVAPCKRGPSKRLRVTWALVVLWWLCMDPTGLLSPK